MNAAAQCIILVALAVTLFRLARTLPWQNVIPAALLIAILAGIFEAVGAKTGIPFGPFFYTENLGHLLFNQVPWPMPLLWVVVLINSRELSRLLLRPWRNSANYGLWVLAVASILAALFDAALEPFASGANHWWIWTSSKMGPTCYGALWINFVGWAVVTFFILAIASPWFINKKVSADKTPDWMLAAIWLGLLVLLGIANASLQQWTAAGLVFGAVVMISFIVCVRVWRGRPRHPASQHPCA